MFFFVFSGQKFQLLKWEDTLIVAYI